MIRPMIRSLALALLLSGCSALVPTQPAPGLPTTVPAVDLSRYTGVWHEVARLPVSFQDGPTLRCEGVTATYTARPDGRIDVTNRCRNALDGGAVREATAIGTPQPGSGNARLRVAFFWPFHGDYWVIGLDPEYRWAVVGTPDRDMLWLLSRSPEMAPADYARAVEIARGQGFPVERLQRTAP